VWFAARAGVALTCAITVTSEIAGQIRSFVMFTCAGMDRLVGTPFGKRLGDA
jgi:hypothetical protein